MQDQRFASFADIQRTLHKQQVKIPLLDASLEGDFQFIKPASLNLVGSYLLQTAAKPTLNVDVAVEIPKAVFNSKDYMDSVYFVKRAIYLSFIAAELRQTPAFARLQFSSWQGNPRKPVLVLNASSGLASDAVSSYANANFGDLSR